MLVTRLTKIAMCLPLAGFCLIVTFDNITDPHSNYQFVQHVMSMDTSFPDNRLMYRGVTSPFAWKIVYGLIIAAEAACGILFLAGAVRMWRARKAPATDFNSSKAYAIAGAFHLHAVVFHVHGHRRRMVRHVAIQDLEWAGSGTSASMLRCWPC
jgi:predicted small integral membrane protein